MEYLQRIPQTGEEVQVGDYLLKTLQVESHRVQKVQLIPLHNGEPDPGDVTSVRLPACLPGQAGGALTSPSGSALWPKTTAYPAVSSHLYHCGYLYCAPPSR